MSIRDWETGYHEHTWEIAAVCTFCDDDRCCVECSECLAVDCFCQDE